MPREPSQERAKKTVQAIVEAGFIALNRHGVAHTTTRHIAEIAGVGAGSLYEYFDNKEAVFERMTEHLGADIAALIQEATPVVAGMPLADAVLELMMRFRELLERDEGRYLNGVRLLLQQGGQRASLPPVDAALTNLALQFVARHPQYSQMRDLSAVGYLVINGGVAVVVRHISESNPPISFDELAHALARMIEHYADGEIRLAQAEAPQAG